MGWFSPIKGHYPSLGQIDKTLPVKDGVTGISRGTIVALTTDTVHTDGVFALPTTTTPAALLYVSLQEYDDSQAGMAGTVAFDAGTAPAKSNPKFPENMNVKPGVPAITGLSLAMDGEYETDQYDASITKETPVGTKLGVTDTGFIKKLEDGDTDSTVIGYLTGVPASRWVNNAIAKPDGGTVPRLATRQGKNVTVIRFATK